jgi:uncharacterized protein (TIGR01777 family)
MKVLISGATGLVGSKLLEVLILNGVDDLCVLSRNKNEALKKIPFPVEVFEWNPEENYIEDGALTNVDIVIHLAGENVGDGRWTSDRKKRILVSRINSTNLLISEIKKLSKTPSKFISASAVGIYGEDSNLIFTEDSSLGNDFLANVCKSWEDIVLHHDVEGMQACCLRTGVVLSSNGGALKKMLPAFLAGVAGKLGNGTQYMSWIHIDDLVNQYLYLINNTIKNNIYNACSPLPITNSEFTIALGSVINRPTLFPVPGFVLKTMFGEMSDILLKGQKVLPNNFLNDGFKFKFTNIKDALSDLLSNKNKGEVVLKKYQWINKPVGAVFHFFSDENNLEQITPPYLKFKVEGKDTEIIKNGTHINYNLKVHGIPLKWKSRISTFEEGKTFTDEQLSGPYAKWIHQHDFIPFKNGTLIIDEVVYKLPMGILGKIAAGYFVNRDIQNIFKYRSEIISKQFI